MNTSPAVIRSNLTTLLLVMLVIQTAGQQQAGDSTQQRKPAATFSLGADLVSRFVWRGADYGNSPAVQPSAAFTVAGFKAAFWGSYSFSQYSQQINDTTIVNMGHYTEFDLYLSYTWKGFTLTAYDYFVPNSLSPNSGNRYFDFCNNTTGHTIEITLLWKGPEKIPCQLSVSTMVYGADKGKDSTGAYGMGGSNNYSTYFEAAFPFNVKGFEIKPFIGAIPFGSLWYGPYGGVINAGFTLSRSIRITQAYSLPLFGTVITNPQAQSVFLVLGISI
jgi:hypothetical protein